MAARKWTDQQVEQMAHLWAEGLTTTEIGAEFGCSKNAIIGVANRTREMFPRRQSPIKSAVRKQVKPVKKRGSTADFVKQRADNKGPCCWPNGDPGSPGFHFCGEPSLLGKSYCQAHYDRAYVKKLKPVMYLESAPTFDWWTRKRAA